MHEWEGTGAFPQGQQAEPGVLTPGQGRNPQWCLKVTDALALVLSLLDLGRVPGNTGTVEAAGVSHPPREPRSPAAPWGKTRGGGPPCPLLSPTLPLSSSFTAHRIWVSDPQSHPCACLGQALSALSSVT